jgi:hypothetical protein
LSNLPRTPEGWRFWLRALSDPLVEEFVDRFDTEIVSMVRDELEGEWVKPEQAGERASLPQERLLPGTHGLPWNNGGFTVYRGQYLVRFKNKFDGTIVQRLFPKTPEGEKAACELFYKNVWHLRKQLLATRETDPYLTQD